MRTPRPPARRQAAGGFSLVEIMVGLVVGLIATIVVMQIFLNAEGSKRITTGGNDALVNGTIALYDLERDLRSAGHDLSAYSLLGCTLSFTPSAESSAVTLTLAPVVINPAGIPGADTNTDVVLVVSGNSNGSSEGDLLTSASTASTYAVATPSSFAVGDDVVVQAATRPATCSLTLGAITAISGSSLTITNGTAGMAVGSLVYNLGQSLTLRAYAVRNGNLTVCDYTVYDCGKSSYTSTLNSTVWVPLASNIVSLRAQYGRDTTNIATSVMDGVIDTFDQTTPPNSSPTLPIYCDWTRVQATRVALVARGAQYDKTTVTLATLTWAGSTVVSSTGTGVPTTNPTAVPINLTSTALNGTASQWQNYRYKVVETLVPLRNALWQGAQAGWEGGTGGC